MEKPILNYTASKIAQAERENNKNFFSILDRFATAPSMDGLLFLYKAGGGTEHQFDERFKVGGFEAVIEDIINGLESGGFLPKGAAEEAKKAMNKVKSNTSEASQSSGDSDKK